MHVEFQRIQLKSIIKKVKSSQTQVNHYTPHSIYTTRNFIYREPHFKNINTATALGGDLDRGSSPPTQIQTRSIGKAGGIKKTHTARERTGGRVGGGRCTFAIRRHYVQQRAELDASRYA